MNILLETTNLPVELCDLCTQYIPTYNYKSSQGVYYYKGKLYTIAIIAPHSRLHRDIRIMGHGNYLVIACFSHCTFYELVMHLSKLTTKVIRLYVLIWIHISTIMVLQQQMLDCGFVTVMELMLRYGYENDIKHGVNTIDVYGETLTINDNEITVCDRDGNTVHQVVLCKPLPKRMVMHTFMYDDHNTCT